MEGYNVIELIVVEVPVPRDLVQPFPFKRLVCMANLGQVVAA